MAPFIFSITSPLRGPRHAPELSVGAGEEECRRLSARRALDLIGRKSAIQQTSICLLPAMGSKERRSSGRSSARIEWKLTDDRLVSRSARPDQHKKHPVTLQADDGRNLHRAFGSRSSSTADGSARSRVYQGLNARSSNESVAWRRRRLALSRSKRSRFAGASSLPRLADS